jgi:hypothetical protein
MGKNFTIIKAEVVTGTQSLKHSVHCIPRRYDTTPHTPQQQSMHLTFCSVLFLGKVHNVIKFHPVVP